MFCGKWNEEESWNTICKYKQDKAKIIEKIYLFEKDVPEFLQIEKKSDLVMDIIDLTNGIQKTYKF